MNSFPRFPWATRLKCWPIAVIGLFATMCWMSQRLSHGARKHRQLQAALIHCAQTVEGQAAESFAAGDFRRAAALLEATDRSSTRSPEAILLQARTLECLSRFSEASEAYTLLETTLATRPAALRARKFCQRMASERQPFDLRSRELLYRLHDELMQRGDAATARFIAEKLLPDPEPLRASVTALLRKLDPAAVLESDAGSDRLNVTIRNLDPRVLALLRNLKIGTLNASRSGLDTPKVLAALDVQSLDLSYNGFSDLSGLRSLPLRRLDLRATRTADVRPLAGMPLGELNLSGTIVSSLHPLTLCPLEKLNLSSTPIRSLEALRGLELRELYLSNTRVSDLSALAGMPLERLAIDGTAIHNLQHLRGAKLKYLSIAGTAVKDLSAIEGMPITELDLRGCELLNDLEPLARCERLERIFLPRHLKPPQILASMPRLKRIEGGKQMTIARE